MKIIINKKDLTPNESWQFFRKVRAIIENTEGNIAICMEGGKYLFPGGKCENNEDERVAIQREILEETGIAFKISDFQKVLELETLYDDFFNYRCNAIKPRHTITTYYYAKTNDSIVPNNTNLTAQEKKQKFKSFFVSKEELLRILSEDHSAFENGKFFDEENQIIMNNILK